MAKPMNWGLALTAVGLASALAACSTATSNGRSASAMGVKGDAAKLGFASRAQAALAANDLGTALMLAEQAVEYKPQEASFRALLGNIYLASGRFASAEAAFRDSLSLSAAQPQIILKLALVQIALGNGASATDLLANAQQLLDPVDLGLALALAGRPDQAVAVLEPAARAIGADARTRQNLALAHALGGQWDMARSIAAQDLPADQVDARMAEWLALATPDKAGTQVATLIGVTPAAQDPGQPVRLALHAPAATTRVAAVAAPVAPAAPAAPVAPVAPVKFAAASVPTPVAVASDVVPVDAVAPIVAAEIPAPAPVAVATVEAPVAAARVAKPRRAAAPKLALSVARPGLTPAAARLSQPLPLLRRASLSRQGRSRTVVQLGAYASRSFVAGAWTRVAAKHGALRNFTPVTARFDSAKGTVYRLSVKGFDSDRQAVDLCASLKRAGASCFVRAANNDAPIQLASR